MTTEEYIKSYTKTCSNQLSFVDGDKRPMFAPWLTPDHGREIASIAREEAIQEAIAWLNDNADAYTWYDEFHGESGMNDIFIEDFKEAMTKKDKV